MKALVLLVLLAGPAAATTCEPSHNGSPLLPGGAGVRLLDGPPADNAALVPNQQRRDGTNVWRIAGQVTLQCRYADGAASSVPLRPGMTCTQTATKFACE